MLFFSQPSGAKEEMKIVQRNKEVFFVLKQQQCHLVTSQKIGREE